MLIRFSILFSILLTVSGCASMFNHSQDRVEVFGTKGIMATDPNGNRLVVYEEDGRQFVHLPTFDTFVTLHYGKASERLMLRKAFSAWGLLNIENFGVGLVLDEAFGNWYYYAPLYVYLDSTTGMDSSLHVHTLNFWESENRPRILIAGAWGVSSILNSYLEGNIFIPPYYEYNIGLSYRHEWEVFYRSSSSFVQKLTPNSTLQNNGLTGIASFILRAYLWNGFFMEAGPSFVHLSADSAYGFGDQYRSAVETYGQPRASIPAISAGLGWSGDFSYIEWHYEYGLKPYQFFDQPPRQFREFIVTLGLIFRI